MENKKIFFSKRASGYLLGKKPMYFLAVLFYLAFAFLFFSFFISYNITSTNAIPANVETTVLINRFLNSPDCFAYEDGETGRAYHGIIDIKKFDDDKISKCYSTNKDKSYSFRFELESANIDRKVCSTPNWGARRFNKISRHVLIYDEGNLYTGRLLISIQK
ncbi:MAG: hypothetical protein KKE93_02150 [Nanoarchaeota archaeon]|nr:hypothetical protein [Nanoarchaeota archaeon]